jgi:hypothetical protein
MTTRGSAARGGTMCCGAVAVAAGMQQLWSDAILDPSLLTILRNTTYNSITADYGNITVIHSNSWAGQNSGGHWPNDSP